MRGSNSWQLQIYELQKSYSCVLLTSLYRVPKSYFLLITCRLISLHILIQCLLIFLVETGCTSQSLSVFFLSRHISKSGQDSKVAWVSSQSHHLSIYCQLWLRKLFSVHQHNHRLHPNNFVCTISHTHTPDLGDVVRFSITF